MGMRRREYGKSLTEKDAPASNNVKLCSRVSKNNWTKNKFVFCPTEKIYVCLDRNNKLYCLLTESKLSRDSSTGFSKGSIL